MIEFVGRWFVWICGRCEQCVTVCKRCHVRQRGSMTHGPQVVVAAGVAAVLEGSLCLAVLGCCCLGGGHASQRDARDCTVCTMQCEVWLGCGALCLRSEGSGAECCWLGLGARGQLRQLWQCLGVACRVDSCSHLSSEALCGRVCGCCVC